MLLRRRDRLLHAKENLRYAVPSIVEELNRKATSGHYDTVMHNPKLYSSGTDLSFASFSLLSTASIKNKNKDNKKKGRKRDFDLDPDEDEDEEKGKEKSDGKKVKDKRGRRARPTGGVSQDMIWNGVGTAVKTNSKLRIMLETLWRIPLLVECTPEFQEIFQIAYGSFYDAKNHNVLTQLPNLKNGIPSDIRSNDEKGTTLSLLKLYPSLATSFRVRHLVITSCPQHFLYVASCFSLWQQKYRETEFLAISSQVGWIDTLKHKPSDPDSVRKGLRGFDNQSHHEQCFKRVLDTWHNSPQTHPILILDLSDHQELPFHFQRWRDNIATGAAHSTTSPSMRVIWLDLTAPSIVEQSLKSWFPQHTFRRTSTLPAHLLPKTCWSPEDKKFQLIALKKYRDDCKKHPYVQKITAIPGDKIEFQSPRGLNESFPPVCSGALKKRKVTDSILTAIFWAPALSWGLTTPVADVFLCHPSCFSAERLDAQAIK
jgi:hypothetical protein